jgi:hypothetical protein
MTPKRIITALLLILVVAGGAIAGLVLLRQRTSVEQEAAVPGGVAEVSIFPTSGSFNVGDTFPISIYFNTANVAVSGIEIRLMYPFTGTTPEVTASDIEINPGLLSSGDWTCPTQDILQESGNVHIEISCANIAETGYATNTDTLFATLNLTINRTPPVSPLRVTFDRTESVITQKSNGQDILLIPSSEGSYTVGGAPQATATPTTGVQATATVTPAATGTGTITPTITPRVTTTGTVTPTVTGTQTLPDAGVSLPTIAAVTLGLFAIIGSILLAL